MKIELEVNDILSKEEIEERAREILLDTLKHKISEESERLLGNAAYYCAHQIMDGLINEDQKTRIQGKTLEIINKLDTGDVFRMADYWHKSNSTAFSIMESTVKENRDRVVKRVIEVLDGYDFSEKLSRDFDQVITDAIIEKLQRK